MRRFIHILVLALIATLALPLSASAVGRLAAPVSVKAITQAPPKKAPAEGLNLPYYEDFNDTTKLKGWTQINPQAEYHWEWYAYGGFDYTGCYELTQTSGLPSNNWLISPGLNLKAGVTYRLTFYVKNWFDANMNVNLMSSATDTTTAVRLYDYAGQDWGTKTIEFEVKADGVYYIGFHDDTPYRHNDTALRYSIYIDNFDIQMLSNNAVPEAVGDLKQVPGANGEVSMGLKWTNPSKSKKGEDLDVLSYVKIFKDGKDSVVISDGVTPGAKMTWTDPNPSKGKHTYSVIIGNTTGESDAATVNTFVGIDKAGAPQDVSVDYDAEGEVINLEWEAPEFGVNGGWFDNTGLSYRIVRQPGNKIVANNLTETSFEDDNVEEFGNYIYYITSRTNAGLGGTAVTEGVVAGSAAPLPIRQDWEDKTTYPAWKIVDNNHDGSTFVFNAADGNNGPNCIEWDFSSSNVGKDKDESLYSPPVELVAGKKYKLTFWVANNPYGSFSLDVTYGKDTTRTAQTNTIVSYADATSNPYSASTTEFEVGESGTYFLSWWLHDSPANYFYLDDIRLEEILDKNIEATAVRNLNTAPTAGDKVSTGVTYTNTGTGRSSSFKVQLLDDDDKVLGEQNVSRPLAAGATGTVNITWTAPDVQGQYGVHGKVIMSGDECESDNITPVSYLNIQPAGTRAVTIGTGTDVSTYAPFTNQGYIFSESIYRGSDFQGMAGNIDSLSLKARFGMERDFPEVPIQVYLGTTDQNDMNSGWIAANRLTKVFDGKLDFNRGVYDFTIPFDQPFNYTGGNLVMLIVGLNDPTLFLTQGSGMGVYVTDYGLGATRIVGNSAKPDPNNPPQSVGSFYSYVPNAQFYFNPSNCGAIKGTVKDGDGNALEGVTVFPTYYKNLTATTDKDGKYLLPYVPSGYAMLQSTAKAYQNGNGYGTLTAGDTLTIDLTMQKCEVISFTGSVVSGADHSPIAGAKVTISGDTEGSATTGEDGTFTIEGVYSGRPYDMTVTADNYKPISYTNTQFRGNNGTYNWPNLSLTPITASPYSVEAIDNGDKATITWKEPIEDVTITKAGDEAVGQFGGQYDMAIGQRFSPSELQAAGADSLYYVKGIDFVPMCTSAFKVSIWQGEEGNEAKVYDEDFTPSTFGQWNTITLQHPYKIDPTKSLVVGVSVTANAGAYPISFDRGPAVEGGDVLWDDYNGRWTTARQELSTMNYNWALKAILGNDNNAAPVEWATTTTASAPQNVKRFGNALSIDSIANISAQAPVKAEAQGFKMESIEKPIAYIKAIPSHNAIKGYNVYRLEAGNESKSWGWTKLNDEPITELNYTDTAWSTLENKPYRYAVRSFYGNPYAWGNGVQSDATFSDGVDKGHYATVTVKVNADKGNALGASVKLSGDGKVYTKKVETADGTVSFSNIRFTQYALQVLKPYYARYNATIDVDSNVVVDTAEIAFAAKAPEQFQATNYIKEARLSWETPSPANSATLTWGNNQFGTSYGFQNGTEYLVGQRFTGSSNEYSNDLKDYDYTDFYIDSIKWYASAATTYSPVVWGGFDGQEVQIFRQDYTVTEDEVGQWVGIRLDEPIKINPKYTYYIGYAATASQGQYPFAIDAGPYQFGGSWMYMYSQREFKYCWSFVSSNGNFMVSAHITDTPDPSKVNAEDIKYNVWRLNAADANSDISTWTKLNSTPIDDEAYVDQTWQNQPDGNYRYAVDAVYFGNTESATTLSRTINKGKVALITLNVKTNNGLSAAGAKVSAYYAGTKYTGVVNGNDQAIMPEMPKGNNYEFLIQKEGYDSVDVFENVQQDEFTATYELKEIKAAPVLVEAEAAADNSSVTVTWREPGAYAPQAGWVYWDNNDPVGGFGTSTGYCAVGQLYNPDDQEAKGMKELDITKISFFPALTEQAPGAGATWQVNIWRRTADGGFEEVLSQDAKDVTLGQWKEVELESPYHVSGDETLLIGYTFRGTGSCMGIDGGPVITGKTDWANFGQGWTTLSTSVSNFNYNILVHAYCEDAGGSNTSNAPAISDAQPLTNAPAKVSVRHSAKSADAQAVHPRLARYNYPVKGYLVYRLAQGDEDNERAWSQINTQPITDKTVTDYTWSQAQLGHNYRWAVKAVYASGMSEPTFSNGLTTDGVDRIDNVTTGDVNIAPLEQTGSFLVTVPQAATLTVYTTAGKLVTKTSLKAGENLIQLNTPYGVYIFNVNGNGLTHTEKEIIK